MRGEKKRKKAGGAFFLFCTLVISELRYDKFFYFRFDFFGFGYLSQLCTDGVVILSFQGVFQFLVNVCIEDFLQFHHAKDICYQFTVELSFSEA